MVSTPDETIPNEDATPTEKVFPLLYRILSEKQLAIINRTLTITGSLDLDLTHTFRYRNEIVEELKTLREIFSPALSIPEAFDPDA